jgi:transposase
MLVAAAILEHARSKPVELWWQDEARVCQQGTLTRVWADEGSPLTLPPYSPELNPVENVWQFLRQNHLSNRVYET